jgi:NAD(P)-dependent dehydrogenase (short-subunit alcohol dehydrogenase family)
MDLHLKGKRAVVSGSTAGIGFAIAAALAREGAAVVVNGRTAARVDEAIRRIRAAHAGAIVEGVACDLGTRAGADRLFDAVPDADVLVNKTWASSKPERSPTSRTETGCDSSRSTS